MSDSQVKHLVFLSKCDHKTCLCHYCTACISDATVTCLVPLRLQPTAALLDKEQGSPELVLHLLLEPLLFAGEGAKVRRVPLQRRQESLLHMFWQVAHGLPQATPGERLMGTLQTRPVFEMSQQNNTVDGGLQQDSPWIAKQRNPVSAAWCFIQVTIVALLSSLLRPLPRLQTCHRSARQSPCAGSPASPQTPPLPLLQLWPFPAPPLPLHRCAHGAARITRGMTMMKPVGSPCWAQTLATMRHFCQGPGNLCFMHRSFCA